MIEREKAVKEVEKRVTESMQIIYKFENELLSKETEGEVKFLEQIIKTLVAKIKEQETLIKQLSQKADSSEKTVKDIAIKALDSASKMPVAIKESKSGEN